MAHLLPGFAPLALLASLTYLSALAVGSSAETRGRSAAIAARNGSPAKGSRATPMAALLSRRRRDSSVSGFICNSMVQVTVHSPSAHLFDVSCGRTGSAVGLHPRDAIFHQLMLLRVAGREG